ncbi:hypothetical protein [Afifella sp. IM 167]|uniref:cell division protein FtsL n=1 Tax=Afifella sp. IM 167 TaxID=2033586 RepID=UPI001CCEB45C|nr:hypothetical protein [Afifella sp. IM 167]MBZ8131649.1 hypothetical protein [Afifella sp. IM 167]
MTRILNVVAIAAALIAAMSVFNLKYRAEGVAKEVAELQRKVDQEKESISLLRAEWSVLNQPDRVEELAERYQDTLGLKPVEPKQLADPAQIPMRTIAPSDTDRDLLSGIAGDLAENLQ